MRGPGPALAWAAAAALIGAGVHLAGIAAMPWLADRAGQQRLAALGIGAGFRMLGPGDLPGLDLALATAACRYDLSAGGWRVRVPATPALVSVAFYPMRGPAFAAFGPDAAIGTVLVIDLGRRPAPQASPAITQQAPDPVGFVVLRLAGDTSARAATLAGAVCAPAQGLSTSPPP